jgi:hypothetical protein
MHLKWRKWLFMKYISMKYMINCFRKVDLTHTSFDGFKYFYGLFIWCLHWICMVQALIVDINEDILDEF